jgi:hypothetical protein
VEFSAAVGRRTPREDVGARARVAVTGDLAGVAASIYRDVEKIRAAFAPLARDLEKIRRMMWEEIGRPAQELGQALGLVHRKGSLILVLRYFRRAGEFLKLVRARCREAIAALAELLEHAPAPRTAPRERQAEADLPPPERLIRPLTLAPLAPPATSGRN